MLKEYEKKRKFAYTPEPKPEQKRSVGKLAFVVQKHQATNLHYDLRLEVNGVLKSWAVPKGPTLDYKEKRLAMMVEDHPYDYKDFEGVIPEGNYGAGTVMIWDQGTYRSPVSVDLNVTESEIEKGLERGHISFILEGQKLKGEFALVKLKRSKEPNAWLLIKAHDEGSSDENILKHDQSAITKRTMREIAASGEVKWFFDIGKLDLSKVPKGDMLHKVKPMLATLIDQPFDKEGWLFEIKWDGYRAIAEIDGGNTLLYSRRGVNYNDKFKDIVSELTKITNRAVLDGEIVIFNKNGKQDFNLIQNYPNSDGAVAFYLFDILYLDDHSLLNEPLFFRRQVLKSILPESRILKLSESIEKAGILFFEAAQNQGLEGIIAKDQNSRYLPGKRTASWLKIKTHQEQDAIIIGYTEGGSTRAFFGSLLLGVYVDGELFSIGGVGTGFNDESLRGLKKQLSAIKIDQPPLKNPPKVKAIHWVSPALVCRVRFQEWTPDNQIRQAVFLGLREDIDPQNVIREKEIKTQEILQ